MLLLEGVWRIFQYQGGDHLKEEGGSNLCLHYGLIHV